MPKKPKPRPREVTGPPLKLTYHHHGGDDVPMNAVAFAEYLIESIKAVKQTANLLAGRVVPIEYKVEHLTKNSPEFVSVVPHVPDTFEGLIYEAQVQHVRTMSEMEDGRIPAFLDFPARMTYRRLGKLSKEGRFATRVQANGVDVMAGAKVAETLSLHLASEATSYGRIRGHIQEYKSAGSKRLIRIFPRVGQPLVGRFREADRTKILGMIDVAYVEAHGKMRFKSGEYEPYHMIIDSIEALNVEGAPTFADMQGFAPDILGGRDMDDFIGATRNGW